MQPFSTPPYRPRPFPLALSSALDCLIHRLDDPQLASDQRTALRRVKHRLERSVATRYARLVQRGAR